MPHFVQASLLQRRENQQRDPNHCTRKGITVSKTKTKRKKSEPPNYKFLGGETEEIGSPNVVFMRPQLAQVYNENFVDVQERGQRKLFRKSKGASPDPKHLTGYPSGLHAILFSKDK